VVLAIFAAFALAGWVFEPSGDVAPKRLAGTIRGFHIVERRRALPPRLVVSLRLADGREREVIVDPRRVTGCHPGDPVTMMAQQTRSGAEIWYLAAAGCVST